MKVRIKDLEPNPFRDIKNYPINQEKIESLTKSINQTGFWDNILARKSNGKIQIAYGHHRLVVLKRDCSPDFVINIPVKDLDDATMIRIMANENDESWGTSPKIIDETVRVTKEFLEKHPSELKRVCPTGHNLKEAGVKSISKFLDGNWYEQRIRWSLERLGLIETEEEHEKHIDKEAIEKLPTERSARDFVRAVKRVKNVTPEQQKKAVEKIIKTQDFGEQSVHKAVIEEKYPYEEKEEKEKEFAEFIEDCAKLMHTLNGKLETLINFKADFDSKIYKETFARFEFDVEIDMLQLRLKQLIKEDKK